MAGRQCYCETCGRTMNEGEFYLSKNIEKYPPDGRMTQCKKCLTMFVDNWNPDTFIPILQEIDVPYVKDEWDKTLERELERTDPSKFTGTTIVGKYLAKMRIKQFKDARFADSERLQEERDLLKRNALRQQGKDEKTIEETLAADAKKQVAKPVGAKGSTMPSQKIVEEEEENFNLGLSEEDITYLRLKWGKGYTHAQWVQMEQLYDDMCESFDIQTAAHKDTLKLICKTSLQANEAIDMHDVETYQKLSKVYDLLMKSGKFTAAQNKEKSGEFVDSVGELVAMCEKQGFIPRYYISKPEDVVDQTLADLQKYTRRLIEDEMGLGEQIEEATKKLLEAQANENKIDENEDEEDEINIEDYDEFNEMLDEQEARDIEETKKLIAGGDE